MEVGCDVAGDGKRFVWTGVDLIAVPLVFLPHHEPKGRGFLVTVVSSPDISGTAAREFILTVCCMPVSSVNK